MKISSNLYNYSSKQNKPQKQEGVKTYAKNPIEKMNYAQSIAFAGWFDFTKPKKQEHSHYVSVETIKQANEEKQINNIDEDLSGEEINKNLTDLIDDIDENTYDKNEKVIEFKKLINHPNYDNDKTIDNLLTSYFETTTYDDDKDLFNYLKSILYLHQLQNNENPTPEIKSFFSNKKNINEFFMFMSFLDESFNKEDVKKDINTLKKVFGIEAKNHIIGLTQATLEKNIEYVKLLLDEGCSPFEKDEDGDTAIDIADRLFNKELTELFSAENLIKPSLKHQNINNGFIKILMKKEIDLNNIDGQTIEELINENIQDKKLSQKLLDIVESIKSPQTSDKHLKTNGELINAFKNNSLKNGNETTIFGDNIGILASKKGKIEILNKLIENPPEGFDPNFINILDKDGSTMLNCAKNYETFLKVLQIKGLDVNLSSSTLDPIIHTCVKNSDFNKFSALMSLKNIDIKKPDKNGHSLINNIDNIESKRELYLKLLESKKDDEVLTQMNNITDKIGLLSPDTIKEYLKYPNIKQIINEPINEIGERLAHYLVDIKTTPDNFYEIYEIYNMFKNANPDINLPDKYGNTPLMKAVLAQNSFATKFFLNNGANKKTTNIAGESAVSMVLDSKNEELKRIFIEN